MKRNLFLILAVLIATVLSLCTGAETVTYSYDTAGRLLSADYGAGRKITWVYDPAGNLLRKTVDGLAVCTLTCEASASPTSGPSPLAVTFQSSATATDCTGGASFSWDFGDGSTSPEQNPSHTYALPNTYTWTLTATIEDRTCTKTGSVTVSAPAIPGDCDGDGTVSIGEVQKAINMFLGTQAPGCGVDCNGGGTVSIGEVQKAINAFLGLPSSC